MYLRILFFFFSLNGLSCSSQIYNTIDKFDHHSSNIYYSSVVQGSALFELKLFNSTLKLGYQFLTNDNTDFIEILRNYGSYLQNFWCSDPLGISIDLKTDGQNPDIFMFMLYVENDLGESDVFAYRYDLSNAKADKWHNLMMPFENFNIFYSSSSRPVLKLEKIKSWRITVFNRENKIQRIIKFKDLKHACNALVHNQPNNLSISSIFVQIWNTDGCSCGQWSEARWHEEISKMNSVGINRLIVQYTVYHKHSWLSKDSSETSTIDKIMNAAGRIKNFQIVLGLYFDEEWNFFNKSDQTYYNFLFSQHQVLIDEIVDLYGSAKSFYGFYIPQEWNNVEWTDDNSLQLFINWTKNLIIYIKSKANFRVLLSPFFRSHIGLNQTKSLYEKFFKSLKINASKSYLDEICIQDSIGVDKSYANNFISFYNTMEVLKEVIEKNMINFGINIELFDQVGKQFVSASPERIIEQIKISKLFTNNLFAFDWTYMMSQNYTLFNQYQKDAFPLNHNI